MDYSEFGRSGTAPIRNSKTPPPTRIRPKTRGGINGTSELSDLNMSLKLEKRNITNNDIIDDAVEDFQFAIENWEKTRRNKQNETSSSRKSNSAYTRGDPVSMAYSSQFKPIKSGSPKASPRLKASKARAVAEIQAAYGLSNNNNSNSNNSNNNNSNSNNSNNTTNNNNASNEQNNDSKNIRKYQKEYKQNDNDNIITTINSSDSSSPPIIDDSRFKITQVEKERQYQPHPPRSGTSRPSSQPVSSHLLQQQQQQQQSSVPVPSSASSVSSSTTTSTSSNIKPSYRRRSDQIRTSTPTNDLNLETTNTNNNYNSFIGGNNNSNNINNIGNNNNHNNNISGNNNNNSININPNNIRGKESIIVNVSPSDNIDDSDFNEYSTLSLGGSESMNTLNYHYDMDTNQRPQSRKLYLGGNTGSPRTTTIEFQSVDTLEGTHHTGMRAPRSAGSLPRHHRLSPELRNTTNSNHTEIINSDSMPNGIILSPWHHNNSTNFNERPPSRQRTAFPIHLADRENKKGNRSGFRNSGTDSSISLSGTPSNSNLITNTNTNNSNNNNSNNNNNGNNNNNSSNRKNAFLDVESTPITLDSNDIQLSSLGSTRAMKITQVSNDLIMESPSGRPPSRQKIAAQYLWGDDQLFEHDNQNIVKSSNIDNISDGLISPLLTPSISTGGISLIDSDNIYSRNLSSPTLPMTAMPSNSNLNIDKNDKFRTSLAPMYDPTADGFTQLESRSQSAPFKIRLNHSNKKSQNVSRTQNRRKDSTSPLINSKSAASLSSPGKPNYISSPYSNFESNKEVITRSKSSENIDDDNIRLNGNRLGTNRRNDYSPALGLDDGLEEDLTILTMYSDDEEEYETNNNNSNNNNNNNNNPNEFYDSQSLILESSLGQDFLNLFAPGR